MGASTSKQLSTFQDKLKNEITLSAEATGDCSAVQKTKIKYGNIDGCPLVVENTCIASTQVDIQQMSEAIKTVTQQLSAENSNSDIVLGQASTSIQETNTLIERINEITASCKSISTATTEQTTEIEVGNCKNSAFTLLNGGDAQANCVLAKVQKEILTLQNEQTAQNTNVGVDLADFATSGLMSLAPSVICCVVVIAAGSMGGDNNN